MKDILLKWNRWGDNELTSGILREITPKIENFINTDDIVVLTGLRRSGKTTILYQLMDSLERQSVPKQAMLHVNFEEPALATKLHWELLETIYETYRAEIYPTGKAYLFLDEIQNVPEWERWVRARSETENIKFFITGSSSKLLSRELGTVLTGRHISFNVWPLNFSELLAFFQIEIPKQPWSFAPPASIQHALNFMLKWGSFPKVVLAENDVQREKLLLQYFDDVLLKDIAMRHSVRNMATLRALAVHLLTNTGTLNSLQRLSKLFDVSKALIQNYCQYFEEAFLINFLPFFSLKVAERQRNAQKTHATDLGIRNLLSISHSADLGKITETLVCNSLHQIENQSSYYWKKKGEIDLLLRKGNNITTMIQVVVDKLENESVSQREINALIEGKNQFKQANAILITAQRKIPEELLRLKDIKVIPLWQFLLDSEQVLKYQSTF